MDKFVIRGGEPLLGTVRVSGAKNAALPCMAAALLTDQPVILENIPQVRDIQTTRNLLAAMGADVELGYGRAHHRTTIHCQNLATPEASYELVKTMRASTLVLGPLVARCGRARVSLPGGCAIGARPIDLHIKGLERLGAKITQEHGYIEAKADRLKGAEIVFDKITVTGTEDLLMAATLAEGETILQNCAREPEVADLADLLNKMGAHIEGAGTPTIRVKGVSKLKGAKHRIIPDRIEAGTFIIAGAMTGGDLNIAGCEPSHLDAVLVKLNEVGVKTKVSDDAVRVMGDNPFTGADMDTEEHPGFPTDCQAQYMALVTQAEGASVITENIFENRFMHAQELVRMGANIKIEGRRAVVRGKTPLSAAAVLASDLRASASLVLAALVADGETIIDRVYHIDRGYEHIEEKLKAVGAQIRRIGEMFPKKASAARSERRTRTLPKSAQAPNWIRNPLAADYPLKQSIRHQARPRPNENLPAPRNRLREMREGRQSIPIVGRLRSVVQDFQRNCVQREQSIPIHRPENAIRGPVRGNERVTCTRHAQRRLSRGNHQHSVLHRVGIKVRMRGSKVQGVVPKTWIAAFCTRSLRDLLNDLRVTACAGRTDSSHLIPIEQIDGAFLAHGDHFVRIRTRLRWKY